MKKNQAQKFIVLFLFFLFAYSWAILENVGCAIYVRDPQTGHILYANEKYQKFFKKTLEELPLSPVSLQDATETKNGLFREIYSEKENRWFDCYSTHIQCRRSDCLHFATSRVAVEPTNS